MKDSYDKLKQIIKDQCGNKPVYYFPNPGNWGDALIRQGTIKLLTDAGVKYKELSKKKTDWIIPKIRGGTVIYGGGGGWCNLWNHSQVYVNKFKKNFDVIVLPSSYESDYSDDKVTFFTRDLYESSKNMPNAKFCHDMAFYIGNDFYKGVTGVGKGFFFRSDAESAGGVVIPSNNNDISAAGRHTTDVTQFFDEVSRFESVYTDRLHVAIAGCLLQKEVHLFLGSYFKSRAVYLSSMKDNFNNIYFHESYDI